MSGLEKGCFAHVVNLRKTGPYLVVWKGKTKKISEGAGPQTEQYGNINRDYILLQFSKRAPMSHALPQLRVSAPTSRLLPKARKYLSQF